MHNKESWRAALQARRDIVKAEIFSALARIELAAKAQSDRRR